MNIFSYLTNFLLTPPFRKGGGGAQWINNIFLVYAQTPVRHSLKIKLTCGKLWATLVGGWVVNNYTDPKLVLGLLLRLAKFHEKSRGQTQTGIQNNRRKKINRSICKGPFKNYVILLG